MSSTWVAARTRDDRAEGPAERRLVGQPADVVGRLVVHAGAGLGDALCVVQCLRAVQAEGHVADVLAEEGVDLLVVQRTVGDDAQPDVGLALFAVSSASAAVFSISGKFISGSPPKKVT